MAWGRVRIRTWLDVHVSQRHVHISAAPTHVKRGRDKGLRENPQPHSCRAT